MSMLPGSKAGLEQNLSLFNIGFRLANTISVIEAYVGTQYAFLPEGKQELCKDGRILLLKAKNYGDAIFSPSQSTLSINDYRSMNDYMFVFFQKPTMKQVTDQQEFLLQLKIMKENNGFLHRTVDTLEGLLRNTNLSRDKTNDSLIYLNECYERALQRQNLHSGCF